MEFLAEIVFAFLAFILGASFASFIYRVAYKYAEGLSLKKKSTTKQKLQKLFLGESKCESCDRNLTALELVPVFAYIFTLGKCRKCGYKVPIKYPISEFLLGMSFALLYFFRARFFNSFEELVIALLVLIVCFLFAIIDIETRRVPNKLIFPVIIVTFLVVVSASILYSDLSFLFERLAAAALGFFFVYAMNVITKEKAFGWGDSKFLVFAGLILGKYLVGAVYFAVILGAIVGVASYLLSKVTVKTKIDFGHFTIPFIPFLSLGTVLMYIVGSEIWHYLSNKFYFA